MKLNINRNPDDHRIPINQVYGLFQNEFLAAVHNLAQDHAPNSAGEVPTLTNEETSFFDNLYVITQTKKARELKEKLRGKYQNDSLFDRPLGQYECDILDFLIMGSKKNILVIGDMGRGKTVLLLYVFRYLLSHSDKLKQVLVPIYIAADHYRDLDGLTDERVIASIFREQILGGFLTKKIKDYTAIDDEDFWTFLKETGTHFSWLDQREADLAKRYADRPEKLRRKTQRFRMKAREDAHFHAAAIKYMTERHNKKVVVIIDNVDPLSRTHQEVIFKEADTFSLESGAKTIVSMRPPTFEYLLAQRVGKIQAYPPVRIEVDKKKLTDFLQRKVDTIKGSIEGEITLDAAQKTVRFKEKATVFTSMIDLLVTDECSAALGGVTNYNLRNTNTLLGTYLSSGFIDHGELAIRIATGATDEHGVPFRTPLWVLLSAIITDNHEMHFSRGRVGCHVDSIINLYCNGPKALNRYLVRIHLLNYLVNAGKQVRFEALQADYASVCQQERASVDDATTYAARRLLDCDLLESPDYYRVAESECMLPSMFLEITESGRYYLNTFRNYFEYLAYMKDDVDLGDNPRGVCNCIDAPTLSERFNEVCKFLWTIRDAESDFLFAMSESQKKNFLALFSSPRGDQHPSILIDPLQSLYDFTETHDHLAFTQPYKELLAAINKDAKDFYDACLPS